MLQHHCVDSQMVLLSVVLMLVCPRHITPFVCFPETRRPGRKLPFRHAWGLYSELNRVQELARSRCEKAELLKSRLAEMLDHLDLMRAYVRAVRRCGSEFFSRLAHL